MRSDRDFDRSWLALFAEELKIARSRAGLSQEQLADQIGYSASLVAKIETRRGVPTLDFAARCDEVLATGEALARMHKFLGKDRSRHGSGRSWTTRPRQSHSAFRACVGAWPAPDSGVRASRASHTSEHDGRGD